MRNKKLKGIVVASAIVGVAISALFTVFVIETVSSIAGLNIKFD